MGDILEIVKELLESGISVEELEQKKREIEEIDEQIKGLRAKIKELEQQKTEILDSIPAEIRNLIFGKRRATATKNGGRYFVEKDGKRYQLREAFYTVYPEKQGKSYKTEYMLKKLEERGYKLVE